MKNKLGVIFAIWIGVAGTIALNTENIIARGSFIGLCAFMMWATWYEK